MIRMAGRIAIGLLLCGGTVLGVAGDSATRALTVEAVAARVRADAGELYRRIAADDAAGVFSRLLDTGGTNAWMKLRTPIAKGWFSGASAFSLRVYVSREGRRKVVVVQTRTDAAEGARRECIYDETGTVVWALSFDSKEEGGGRLAGKLREAFEFDRRGRMLRAWERDGTPALLARGAGGVLHQARGTHAETALFGALLSERSGLTVDEGSLEGRLQEDLSCLFESMTVDGSGFLSVKTQAWGRPVEERRTSKGSAWALPKEGVSTVAPGERVVFRQGAHELEFLIGGDAEARRRAIELPADFAGRTNLVFCLRQGRWAILSPEENRVFFPREWVMRTFHFPFAALWTNETSRRRWEEERFYRSRLGEVLRAARRRKEQGLKFLQQVRTDADGNSLTARGGIFVDESAGDGIRGYYLFDEKGSLKWAFELRGRMSEPLVTRTLNQEAIFEYAEGGELRRTLLAGAVLTVKGTSFEFARDEDSRRRFFADWKQAMEKVDRLRKE